MDIIMGIRVMGSGLRLERVVWWSNRLMALQKGCITGNQPQRQKHQVCHLHDIIRNSVGPICCVMRCSHVCVGNLCCVLPLFFPPPERGRRRSRGNGSLCGTKPSSCYNIKTDLALCPQTILFCLCSLRTARPAEPLCMCHSALLGLGEYFATRQVHFGIDVRKAGS